MMMQMLLIILVVVGTPWGLARGASDQETIVFGQSAALTGPARELGIGMRLGLLAAFSEVNRKGGIHGYRLQLESLDDRYEPEAAIANTRSLIEKHKVFALIGAVGTPTSKSAQPVATEAGVPYIAPFTGAEFLRDAKKRPNVVNVRASYYQETEEMVVRLNEDLGINRISIFYQNDSFGQAGLNGLRQAVNRHGLSLIEEVYYTRNTEAVKIALLDLRRANAEAVVIVGAYKPAATMIRWARRLNFNPYFINISFIGSAALAKALGPDGTGVYVTQVVPFPRDTTLPIVAQYQEALQAIDTRNKPSFVSLEGYLAGRIAIEGLQLAGPAPTRKGFLQALARAGDMDLGGFRLRYGVDDNQGSDRVYLTRIDDKGRFQAVDKMSPP
ncbi:MAG: ABC transporter substrate-binding protein [Nitrospira sp. SB0677_bin_15]|nr:ABC transporter substrate-binding protein [Nitrospira sp. SB0667_bin_9]MYD32170.1 ABC transporter substrate-binding protein [Nitrospira sp. SB0661_bin_20]MYG41363.1 ABC transporter substrate-binding protein [Nitrospira sp. SB0677_bin_15]MYH02147.1 ABC transporter substrate-binding protein [Nitrospira sp. SB0675_bin_23]MYJ23286.1 ABC transporter substrate-binding protein [Nitrospira sp. SB0673_bin_12]